MRDDVEQEQGGEQPDELLGAADFEFDMAGPFFEQVRHRVDEVTPIPLTTENIAELEDKPGVYVLYHNDAPRYVGKADDSVVTRLTKHLFTLSGVQNIDVADMKFKCVYLASTWNPLQPEADLMNYLGTNTGDGWNNKGFGSNEPGVRRGGTMLKVDHFYRRFPIKPDWRTGIRAGRYTAFQLLTEIKNDVPFWFKFQGYRIKREDDDDNVAVQQQAREELQRTMIDVPQDAMCARELLLLIARNLPGDWQATITPTHMLLYRERDGVYPMMEVIWPERRQ